MDDALLVRRFQRFRNLFRDRKRFIERNRSTRDPLSKSFTLNQLHHEHASAVRLFETVDGAIRRRPGEETETPRRLVQSIVSAARRGFNGEGVTRDDVRWSAL